MTRWRRHPGVRSGDDLTFGERAADRMRNGFGSWTFLAGCLLFIVAWIAATERGWLHIDNAQLTILNLVLSTFAALQGGIILLAAKRSDTQASELAHHDFTVNQQALEQIEENTRITRMIVAHLGIADGEREPKPPADGPADGDRKGFLAP